MNLHPPLMEKVAVRPVRVRFSLEELVVRCPKCGAKRYYDLTRERIPAAHYCPGCGWPWRWR